MLGVGGDQPVKSYYMPAVYSGSVARKEGLGETPLKSNEMRYGVLGVASPPRFNVVNKRKGIIMKIITEKWLESGKLFKKRTDWFLSNKDLSFDELYSILMGSKEYDYLNWFLSRLMTKENQLKYGLYAIKFVLAKYIKRFPKDDKVPDAVISVNEYLLDPCNRNHNNVKRAANQTEKLAKEYLDEGIRLQKLINFEHSFTRAVFMLAATVYNDARFAAAVIFNLKAIINKKDFNEKIYVDILEFGHKLLKEQANL